MSKLQKQVNELRFLTSNAEYVLAKYPEARLTFKATGSINNSFFIRKTVSFKPEFVFINYDYNGYSITLYNTLIKPDGTKIKIYNLFKQSDIAKVENAYSDNFHRYHKITISFRKIKKICLKNLMEDGFRKVLYKLLDSINENNKEHVINYIDSEDEKNYKPLIEQYYLLK